MDFKKSIIEPIKFNGSNYFIKRDDLIHPIFNGNKIRKFYFLFDSNYKKIHIYGGNQSNTIPALSFLAEQKKIEVYFYTKKISDFLKNNPIGNYKVGLKNIIFIEIANEIYYEIIEEIRNEKFSSDEIFIEIGGHQKEAEIGVNILANEILDWAKKNNKENLNIFLPSGTGTTALFLQKNLPFKVFTNPCIGDETYLKKQFFEIEKNETLHPIILNSKKKYHFGKLYKVFLDVHYELKSQTNIEFELLYDSLAWITLEENKNKINGDILYIHQGGTIGNESQKSRYKNLGI